MNERFRIRRDARTGYTPVCGRQGHVRGTAAAWSTRGHAVAGANGTGVQRAEWEPS
jgi:hypothetical protein